MVLAKSKRIGPSGDDQMIEAPADVRISVESAPTVMQLLCVKAGKASAGVHTPVGLKLVRPVNPYNVPASAKMAPFRPRSLGRPKIGNCTSRLPPKYVVPPSGLPWGSPTPISRGPMPKG